MSNTSKQDTDEEALAWKPQIKKQEDIWDQGHRESRR